MPKATPLFRQWSGDTPADTFNHKPVLEFDGEMVFAELAILRIFQKAGWQGRWIDSYRKKYRIGYWGENISEPLPPKQFARLDSIKTGCFGGCFDVFCWRDETFLFVEAKWKGRDTIRPSQRAWLEAALDAGLSKDSFLIAEWSFSRPPLSKELQLRVFRKDHWICHWCDRPVIFAAAMRLLDREMKNADWKGKIAYYHKNATRDGAPLLDELWAVIDHVKAFSLGGLNREDNLTTACNKCNGRKNSAPLDRWGNRIVRKPIKGKYGPPLHWDGLSGLFVVLAQRDPVGLSASEKAWLKVLTGAGA